MAELSIRNVTKSYGTVGVLNGVSIEVEEGAFVVILGPSGCGKSTLLHAVAGLHPIDGGAIVIEGRDVTALPARERDVAMVLQSYALYPTMTVRDNIAFPLRMRRLARAAASREVDRVAAILQIAPLLARYPRELSGGQRQRVAIGRALVRDPKPFLFDEPLSNLGAALRGDLRAEIEQLHQRIGRTMVYVTHDQIEAMTLATKIVILNKGAIQQVGTPHEIYRDPANLFVARFIGSPPMTLLAGRMAGGAFVPNGSDARIPLAQRTPEKADVLLGLRPEDIALGTEGPLSASVALVEPTGPEDIVTLDVAGQRSVVRVPAGLAAQGAAVRLGLRLDHALLFDAATGERMR